MKNISLTHVSCEITSTVLQQINNLVVSFHAGLSHSCLFLYRFNVSKTYIHNTAKYITYQPQTGILLLNRTTLLFLLDEVPVGAAAEINGGRKEPKRERRKDEEEYLEEARSPLESAKYNLAQAEKKLFLG